MDGLGNTGTVPAFGYTHGGKFHADDVFATALLRILNPQIQIERGFAVPEDFSGIVYDIGRGEFDHHQKDKAYRKNGCPYAAFGLIWRAFGPALVGKQEAERFDAEFIQPLDESDNTGCDNLLAQVVEEFNPTWDEKKAYDRQFWRAVDMAQAILSNHFRCVESVKRGQAIVQKDMEESDGQILVLSVYAPWKTSVIGSSYLFVVYPSNRGGFSVQGVPKSADTTQLVCPFPQEWCGADAPTLAALSGIKTLHFCHPSGFLAATDTRQDAICAAKLAIAAAKEGM